MSEIATLLSERIAEICDEVKLAELKAAGIADLVFRLRTATGEEALKAEWEGLVQQLANFTLAADVLFKAASREAARERTR